MPAQVVAHPDNGPVRIALVVYTFCLHHASKRFTGGIGLEGDSPLNAVLGCVLHGVYVI